MADKRFGSDKFKMEVGETLFYTEEDKSGRFPFIIKESKVRAIHPLIVELENNDNLSINTPFYRSKLELFKSIIRKEEHELSQKEFEFNSQQEYVEDLYGFAMREGIGYDEINFEDD